MRIETLVVGNHVEAVNGTLYMMGAGLTDIRRPRPLDAPALPSHFGIGLSVLTPWNDTNRRRQLTIWLEDEDGRNEIWRAETAIEVGRPPGVTSGAEQRAVLAVDANIAFPSAGGYRLAAEIDGDSSNRHTYSFRVHDIAVKAA